MSEELPDDFDPLFYLQMNPDVAAAGFDPVAHYLQYGRREGRVYNSDNVSGISKHLQKSLARYCSDVPCYKNAFELFQGSWSTRIPGMINTGQFEGFDDSRIEWMLKEIGDISGFSILELGPLEAGHSFMLERAGGEVTAIEANYGAFVRCLVVKNHLGMKAKFLLGDFEKYDFGANKYDLIVASGVLYHMVDPVGLIKKLSEGTRRIFLWTHYFDENLDRWSPELRPLITQGKWEVSNIESQKLGVFTIRLVKQNYLEALDWSGFCGGTREYSYWIFRDDILSLLRVLGFEDIRIGFDMPSHPNGPAMAVLAQRKS